MTKERITIVGAGIVGLAHAYIAAAKGHQVTVFEREEFSVGASVRNFGLVWPIGQAPGKGLDRALRSRQHWLTISEQARIWLKPNGSLHLAYHEDEENVLQEFLQLYGDENYDAQWLSAEQVLQRSPGVVRSGLRGGMFSKTECTVYSRQAIRQIPQWLTDTFGVTFCFSTFVHSVSLPRIETSRGDFSADRVYICSGNDFETLYPKHFQESNLTRCKLQMMKASPRSPLELGPSLCAGLTLRHYDAFRNCQSLAHLSRRLDEQNILWRENGIHVLVSQNALGELIIGDSHHYGLTLDPFDSEQVNRLIWDYLGTFFQTSNLEVTERWHGIYPKHTGRLSTVIHPEPDVTIINGLSGAGMTLSFGLAEETLSDI